jgi:hypothetical protein
MVNGPLSNRVNLVVLAEGYTAAQAGQFLRDATNLVETFFGAEPYRTYRGHFNASAIFVASAESGSDHPTTGGPYRNTYFNSAYEFYDYVITIPPNGLDPDPAHGVGKVEALLSALMPEADIVILLVNDIQPGGSSGVGGPAGRSNRLPIITALNPFPPYSDIVVHESGHFFAGLVDEYTNPYPGYTPVEAPNATRETDRDRIPWKAWIDPATPVPRARSTRPPGGTVRNMIARCAPWGCRFARCAANRSFAAFTRRYAPGTRRGRRRTRWFGMPQGRCCLRWTLSGRWKTR